MQVVMTHEKFSQRL